jgi:hypothetical protein
MLLLVADGGSTSLLERSLVRAHADNRLPHEIHIVGPRAPLTELQTDLLSADGAGGFGAMCARLGITRDEVLFNQRSFHLLNIDAHTTDLCPCADRIFHLFHQLHAGHHQLTVIGASAAGSLAVITHGVLQIVAKPADRFLLDMGAAFAEVPLLLLDEVSASTYREVVSARRAERVRRERPDPLRISVRKRHVRVSDTPIALPAMQFFWLYYLACTPGELFPLQELSTALSSSRRASLPLVQRLSDGRTRTFPHDLQRAFARVFPKATDKFEAMFQRACGPQPGLPSTVSKINAALRRALGRGAEPYLIRGGRGTGGYRLTLDSSLLVIAE